MADLRHLPKVDELSRSPELASVPARVRVEAARQAVASLRDRARAGHSVDVAAAPRIAAQLAQQMLEPSLRPAINLSGVILHTGIGRARLAAEAVANVAAVAASHSAVELDLEDGRRGDRQEHVRGLLKELTGAEDAHVVNNAAGGVFLTLNALASGKEVILSRGQMVEIGGSFRMPDIVRESGCRLVEVGCTNKTYLRDYLAAITGETAAVLRCHPSNFVMLGFVHEPALEELAAMCRERGILLLDDQGSGCLVDLSKFGLPPQPTLPGSVSGGADVSIASGDKLLGGPQAGLIVGKAELIARIRSHPLARALRVDKLTLAALEATLRLYAQGRELEIPALAYLARSLDEVKRIARLLSKAYKGKSAIEAGITQVGGGSAPGTGVPTWRVGLHSPDPDRLAASLRANRPPIVGRIEDGVVWLDPRTLDASEVKLVQDAVASLQ